MSADDRDNLLRDYLAAVGEPCPSCGYDLKGLTGRHCPECGQALRLRVGLARAGRWIRRQRSRTRWMLAAAAWHLLYMRPFLT